MDDFCVSLYKECGRRAEGLNHVLCVQDTTELNYGSNSGRIDAKDEHFGYGTGQGSQNCLYIPHWYLMPLMAFLLGIPR